MCGAAADTLSGREQAAAPGAACGLTTPEIAVRPRLDEQTAGRLLSAVHRKIGTDRSGLAGALGE